MIEEIKVLVSGSRDFVLQKVNRIHNRVAHVLANFARTDRRTVVRLRHSPDYSPCLFRLGLQLIELLAI